MDQYIVDKIKRIADAFDIRCVIDDTISWIFTSSARHVDAFALVKTFGDRAYVDASGDICVIMPRKNDDAF